MTDNEIRIAIAEACGWTVLEPEVHPNITYEWGYPKSVSTGDRAIIPDYPNDLNWMHQAEKTLDDMQWDVYLQQLGVFNFLPHGHRQARHATARQLAEAFLRTIGKWKD